jgi:hypothetical protein
LNPAPPPSFQQPRVRISTAQRVGKAQAKRDLKTDGPQFEFWNRTGTDPVILKWGESQESFVVEHLIKIQ